MALSNLGDIKDAVPYSIIAKGYDLIMSHVDYGYWAEFTDKLLWQFHPNPFSIRELGCGTGTFALHLQPLGNYKYLGTDFCAEMIDVARQKAQEKQLSISFSVEDFSDYSAEEPHDVVILLYDGLNYLIDEDQIQSLFSCTFNALKPGGLFFFDQSTPANSINNEEFFRDEGEMEGFSYVRGSTYDHDTCLHTTTFEIHTQGKSFFERHVQRAYAFDHIKSLIEKTPFEIEKAFDGFSSDPATKRSERVHWMVRKPES